MMKSGVLLRLAVAAALLPGLLVQRAFGWGHDGHSLIDRTAAADLPDDVPAFLRSPAAQAAMDYYGPEPDRWLRKATEPHLYRTDSPDHFIDMEYADLGGPLPAYRNDYLVDMTAMMAKHPEVKLAEPEAVGLLPYVIVEDYEQLKDTMRTYRMLVATKQDTKPVEAEIVFLAGILGHFVGDGSQPLHTTMLYNGWVGPNPNGYTTEHKIHGEFEGDFIHNNLAAMNVTPLVPAKPVMFEDATTETMAYLHHTHTYVEQTYQMYKAGAFSGAGTEAGKAFVNERLAAGVTELRNFIYTAWVRSGDPIPKTSAY